MLGENRIQPFFLKTDKNATKTESTATDMKVGFDMTVGLVVRALPSECIAPTLSSVHVNFMVPLFKSDPANGPSVRASNAPCIRDIISLGLISFER